MPAPLAAFCGTHATAPAVATCKRCGIFLCDACVTLDAEESFCAACAARRNAPPTQRARAALFVPLAALVSFSLSFAGPPLSILSALFLPLWLLGVGLVFVARRELKQLGVSHRNQWFVTAGTWVAGLTLLIIIPVALAILAWFFGDDLRRRFL